MLHRFCPDYWHSNVLTVNYCWLLEHNIKMIILDVDNTLLPWDALEPETEFTSWVRNMMKLGLNIVLLSNNGGERVQKLSTSLGVEYVTWAGKPFPSGFLKAYRKVQGVAKEEVLVIGDQILTDILGAKLVGFQAMWVDSLAKKEFLGTRITRQVERIVVKRLQGKKLLPRRETNEDCLVTNGNQREK